MKQAAELVRALKVILDKGDNILHAVVTSVDKVSCVCVVEYDGLEIGDVRLRATVNEHATGMKAFPVIGSSVLVEKINDEEFFVVMFSEVEIMRVETDTTVFEVQNGFLLQKDQDTLKQVLTLMVQSIQNIVVLYGSNPDYIKLNQALTKINNLLK